jgi:hypothetical protein
VRNSQPSNGRLAGSLVINNAKLVNVPIAVGVLNGPTVLAGGTRTINSWAQGNVYGGTNANPQFRQGDIPAPAKNGLTDGSGKIFGKSRPQYATYATSQIVSVKSEGAKGDGRTDDTQAIKNVISSKNQPLLFISGSKHSTQNGLAARLSSSMLEHTSCLVLSPFHRTLRSLVKHGLSLLVQALPSAIPRDHKLLSRSATPDRLAQLRFQTLSSPLLGLLVVLLVSSHCALDT